MQVQRTSSSTMQVQRTSTSSSTSTMQVQGTSSSTMQVPSMARPSGVNMVPRVAEFTRLLSTYLLNNFFNLPAFCVDHFHKHLKS